MFYVMKMNPDTHRN